MELTPDSVLRDLSFAVVDLETTGSGLHRGDRVMEIGIVHVRGEEITTALDMLIDPQQAISPFVARLTKIRWDMVCEAPTFGDVADMVRDALTDHVFVAHNVRFDWRFLAMELQRVTGRGMRGERLCTVKFARKLLPFLRRRNLDSLAWHYEVPIIGRHRAGGDARATARVLQHMLADARRQDIDTWGQLQEFMRTPRIAPSRSYLPQPVRDEAVA